MITFMNKSLNLFKSHSFKFHLNLSVKRTAMKHLLPFRWLCIFSGFNWRTLFQVLMEKKFWNEKAMLIMFDLQSTTMQLKLKCLSTDKLTSKQLYSMLLLKSNKKPSSAKYFKKLLKACVPYFLSNFYFFTKW